MTVELDDDSDTPVARRVDPMLAEIAAHRRALEASLALAAKTLYPELWRELAWERRRNRDLEAENERLRSDRQDQTPTEELPVVPAAPRRGRRRAIRGRAS